MRLRRRHIDMTSDTPLLLDLHCAANYHSESAWARCVPYERYRARWMLTPQPDTFLRDLAATMADSRTLACIWETEAGEAVGYAWATLHDVEGYPITIAELRDIAVKTEHRGRGFGRHMLSDIEARVRERGADVLRVETGGDNTAARAVFERAGCSMYRVGYEKVLDNDAVARIAD